MVCLEEEVVIKKKEDGNGWGVRRQNRNELWGAGIHLLQCKPLVTARCSCRRVQLPDSGKGGPWVVAAGSKQAAGSKLTQPRRAPPPSLAPGTTRPANL